MTTYVWDSHSGLNSDHFSGYAFVDVDYVYGQNGADQFRVAHGKPVPGGHDGCYLVARNEDGTLIFETDYAGFQPLYYYADGGYWAVSGSWADLHDHLTARGVHMRMNSTALVTAGPWMSEQQLTSFETPVHGIRLVPCHQRLEARGTEIKPVSVDAQKTHSPDYDTAIKRTLALWVGRFQTLLSSEHELNLSLDISGGRDSRVIFALYMAAKRRMSDRDLSQTNELRLISSLAKRSTKDFAVASDLAAHYGLSLNEKPRNRAPRLAEAERWDAWRSNCLGAYSPMIFPRERMNGAFIHFGGNAAGNQRSVYQQVLKVNTVDAFVQRHAERIDKPTDRRDYASSLYRAFEQFPGQLNDEQALGEYYRQFRGRLHGSAYALPRVCFFPFASHGFDEAREAGGSERFEDAQVNYDVMGLIEPTLLELPYDDPAKSPSEAVRARLLQGDVEDFGSLGQVFGDLHETKRFDSSQDEDFSLTERLKSAFDQARSDAYVTHTLPTSMTVKAFKQVALFSEKGAYSKPGSSWPVAPHLTTHLLAPSWQGTVR